METIKLLWVTKKLVDVFWGEGWYNHIRLRRVSNKWESVNNRPIPDFVLKGLEK